MENGSIKPSVKIENLSLLAYYFERPIKLEVKDVCMYNLSNRMYVKCSVKETDFTDKDLLIDLEFLLMLENHYIVCVGKQILTFILQERKNLSEWFKKNNKHRLAIHLDELAKFCEVPNLGQALTPIVNMVNYPSHYGGEDNPYEVIKVCEAWGLDKDAYLFNTVKYVARAGKKNKDKEVEDLEKALFYLQRKITNLKLK